MNEKYNSSTITNHDMIVAELNSEYLGISHFQLMEAAGTNVASEIVKRYPQRKTTPFRIHVIAGPGKNGGDGFTAARHLASQGYKVSVTFVGRRSDLKDQSTKKQLESLLQMQDTVKFENITDSSQLKSIQTDVILDAILGTGVHGDLREPLLGAVRIVNNSEGVKIAIDLPSGLDTDTGEPHRDAVKADITLSLHRIKVGLTKNNQYTGKIVVIPIGIPREAETYAGPGDVKTIWREPPRNPQSTLLVIGRNESSTNHSALSALAATKIGRNLVYVAYPDATPEIMPSYSPHLVNVKLSGEQLNPRSFPELEKWIDKVDTVILGPGSDLYPETKDTIERIITIVERSNKTLVLHGDPLKTFPLHRARLKTNTLFILHETEVSEILQGKANQEIDLRKEIVIQLAKQTNSTIILKGSMDIIADENGKMKLNKTGTASYMNVKETGEVLAGIIGGLLAQQVEIFQAAIAGAFLNRLAGDILNQEKGPIVTPLGLIDHIPKAIKYCINGPPFPPIRINP